jgi:hypothetical protein
MMQKILIISKVFFPNISPRANRTTQLALEFAKLGNEVTVMIPDLDEEYYCDYSVKTGITFKTLGQTKFKPIIGDSLFKRALTRLLLLIFEYPDIQLVWMIKKVLEKERNWDLLISVAVPHPIHWGVSWAKKTNNNLCKVWVADCGDPYMGCKTDTFKKLFYFKYIERMWCKFCNFISVPEKSSIDGYYTKFHSKIRIIPQGFNFNEIEIPQYSNNIIPTFAYAGALALHFRNPYPLLEYLCSLKFEFKFIVYNNSGVLDPFKDRLKHKLEVRNYISREELLKVLSSMDFLINFDNNTSVQTPSKLIDYAIVKRPVLSIAKELNYVHVDEFLNANYTNRYQMPDLSNYDIRNVAKKFLDLFNDKL